MLEYELGCVMTVTPDNKFKVDVQISRSIDGSPMEVVANFSQEVKSAIADSMIMDAIRRRFEEYCRADSDRIAKSDLAGRASAIQTAVDGLRFIP